MTYAFIPMDLFFGVSGAQEKVDGRRHKKEHPYGFFDVWAVASPSNWAGDPNK